MSGWLSRLFDTSAVPQDYTAPANQLGPLARQVMANPVGTETTSPYASQSVGVPRGGFDPLVDPGASHWPGQRPMLTQSQYDATRNASLDLFNQAALVAGSPAAEEGAAVGAVGRRAVPTEPGPPGAPTGGAPEVWSPPQQPTGFTAYHGSPHDFPPTARNPLGEFDPTKIGTGEGAQAYGVGAAYLAENEGVARGYRDALSTDETGLTNSIFLDGKPVNARTPSNQLTATERAALRIHYSNGIHSRAAGYTQDLLDVSPPGSATAKMEQETLDALQNNDWTGRIKPNPGHMYEVNVNADPEHFLDWDKPLSEQHPVVQKVMADRFDLRPGGVKEREAYLASLPNDELRAVATKALDNPNILGDAPEFARLMKEAPDIDHNAVWDIQRASLHPEGWGSYSRQPTTMGDIYRDYLGNPAETSAALRDAGIPGIRYLDAGSRGAGSGTYNHVVFDANTLEIIRKYGIAGLLGGTGAVAGTQQPSQ